MNLKRIFLLTALAFGAATLSPAQIYPQEELHFRAPAVPKQIIFAGDTIRFDRSDLYERMDRELIAFTYMHSNSILMLKKSDRFFKMVEPILKQNGIPDDLKYLMAIEATSTRRHIHRRVRQDCGSSPRRRQRTTTSLSTERLTSATTSRRRPSRHASTFAGPTRSTATG